MGGGILPKEHKGTCLSALASDLPTGIKELEKEMSKQSIRNQV